MSKKIKKLFIGVNDMQIGDIVVSKDESNMYLILDIKICTCSCSCKRVEYIKRINMSGSKDKFEKLIGKRIVYRRTL